MWTWNGKELEDEKSLSSQTNAASNLVIKVESLKYANLRIDLKDQKFESLIPIYPCYTIQELKLKFEREIKISSHNQIWTIDELNQDLKNDSKLTDYILSPTDSKITVSIKDRSNVTATTPKTKSKEKKVFKFEYEGRSMSKQFSIDEDVSAVREAMIKSFKLPEGTRVILKYQEEAMSLERCLSDYMSGPGIPIKLEVLINEKDLDRVVITYEGKEQEFVVKKGLSIQKIRDIACLEFNIRDSYLYSLFLDDGVLLPSKMLQDIPDFGEESVLVLCCRVNVSWSIPSSDKESIKEVYHTIFDPTLKIEELKKQILIQNKMKETHFYLVIGNMRLEESYPLNSYIFNEEPVLISIVEKEKEQIKTNILFKKVMENKEYEISVLKNTDFSSLREIVSKEFSINNSNQVWKCQDHHILNQSELEMFLAHYEGKEEKLVIDVFGCPIPFTQKVYVVIHYPLDGPVSSSGLLDLAKTVGKLKQEIANEGGWPKNYRQIWKIDSKELKDEFPLAVQYKPSENKELNIYIEDDKKELSLLVEGKSESLTLDLYVNILQLKETLFKENKVGIHFEKQIWSLEKNDVFQTLQDTQTLHYYFGNNSQKGEIVIQEKSSSVKIMVNNDLEIPIESLINVESDTKLLIRDLKQKLKTKFIIDPSKQCWLIDNIELKDNVRLKDEISRNRSTLIRIEISKLMEFTLIEEEKKYTLESHLHMKVSDFKERFSEKYQEIDTEKFSFEVDGRKLEDEKRLGDYFESSALQSTANIQMKILSIFRIHFLNKKEEIYFYGQIIVNMLMKEVRQKFSLKNHEFLLKDGDKEIKESDGKESLQKGGVKTLICVKYKELRIVYQDLNKSSEQDLTMDASTSLSSILSEAAKKLGVSVEECSANYKGSPTEEEFLDNLDPGAVKIEVTISTVKELRVRKLQQVYILNYLPSDTVEAIKSRLIPIGFTDVKKFSLRNGDNLLEDDQILSSYGMKYGRFFIDAIPNKRVSVTVKGEEYSELCGGKIKSVGQLKQQISISHKIDIEKQLLLLVNNEKWERILSQDDERLMEIETGNPEEISIVCKAIKKFSIRIGSHEKIESFEGLNGGILEEQKNLFELIYKIPIEQQVWVTRKNKNVKLIEEDEFAENFAEGHYTNANPLQIFRTISLSVCLNDESHIFLKLPTHKTVKMQKDEIDKRLAILPQNQKLFYGDTELDDECMLDDYFNLKENANSHYALDLIVQEDLEYYGFTERNEITNDIFQKFFIESDEDLDHVIEEIHFNKKDDGLVFRNKLLGLFFSTLKKHSLWESLIRKIKERTYTLRGINLWQKHERSGTQKSHFNTQFLLYYFLNSGTPELNIEILQIMKIHFPVPLTIDTWSNRFSVEGTKILNELFWVMQKGFVITSFGYGGAENKACGKSELNNRVLHSNFVQSPERSQICKGCPEIAFDLYKNNKFPINLIDIPSGTNQEIKNKIIEASNMLIIHSLADEETTRRYIQSFNCPIIIIYRDCHNAFSNVSSFRQSLAKSYTEALNTGVFETKIIQKPNYSESNELSELSEKINEYILHTFQTLKDDKELWKFFRFYKDHNQSVHSIFDGIHKNSSQIVKAISVFNQLKMIERSNKPRNEKDSEIDKLMNDFKQNSLTSEMTHILETLSASESISERKYAEKPRLILAKLQEYLRMMKSQQTIDFYKLYEHKSRVNESTPETEEKILEEFSKYWEVTSKQNRNFKEMNGVYSGKIETKRFIESCIEIFEQTMIPNIFSIELFWRELIYFNSLRPTHQITMRENKHNQLPISLDDFLVSLKKEDILNSSPFEIVDGDLLYMAKEFYKTVFKGMSDHVVVISVLGPQSSGKSTLLNFLFGCNFVTSSGRCTKGIYGTYFKVSNFNSCDGILVLDTEGLFGLLNEKEKETRDKFDKKLVLFCLAMSDFVFINFKGDIDITLTNVLEVCQNSLQRLQQGNVQTPDFFLVLNQNTQTNLDTQLQDIDKMAERGFSRANVEVLPLAFETLTNKSAAVAKFMEPVMKKTPKEDFSDKCSMLASRLFRKIQQSIDSRKQRTLENIIDRMEQLWELLDKFPDLLKHDTLMDKNKENEIKDWIENEVDMKFAETLAKFAQELKGDSRLKLSWEKDFNEKSDEESSAVIDLFNQTFQKDTQEYLFRELESVLFAHLKRIKIEKLGELTVQSHQEKIKNYDAQGSEKIREAAYKVKNTPNITEEEIDEIFEEKWAEIVSRVESDVRKEEQSERLFYTVYESYKANINKSAGALKKLNFPPDRHSTLQECLNGFQNIYDEYMKGKSFEYTNQPPALVFRGGKTNVSGVYFNLKEYFMEEEVEENFGIPRNKLYDIFDFDKIRQEISKDPKSVKGEDYIVNTMMSQLQKELSDCGICIPEAILKRNFKTHVKFWGWKHSKINNNQKSQEFKEADCMIIDNKLPGGSIKFLDVSKLSKAKEDKGKGLITLKCFNGKVFKDIIKWGTISKDFQSRIDVLYKTSQADEFFAKVVEDLSKIHLSLGQVDLLFNLLDNNEPNDLKNKLNRLISSERPSNDYQNSSSEFLQKITFNYLKKDIIENTLQKITKIDDNQFVIIHKFKGKKKVVKEAHKNIEWLDDYAKENNNKILANTLENKTLLPFVLKEFKFGSLLEKILEICMRNIEKSGHWNSRLLYRDIVREVNNCIGAANNDLQQIAYQLDYALVSNIHAEIVFYIWKFFEKTHWEKISGPLEEMKKRKEQQKIFFKSIASSDLKQINSAEAKRAKEYLEGRLIPSIVKDQTKHEILIFSGRFKNEVKRKEIQEKLDKKYFSLKSAVTEKDLFDYITDPHNILANTYELEIQDHVKEIKSRFHQMNRDLKRGFQDLLDRLISIDNLLRDLPEESLNLENVFEFTECSRSEKGEIALNKYDSQLGGLYYQILLLLLQGSALKNHPPIKIDNETKVLLKGVDTLPASEPLGKSLIPVVQDLKRIPGRITNLKIFVGEFVEQIRQFVKDFKEPFEFTSKQENQFTEQIHLFICPEKCPCCDRICGEEDPNHNVHQCLYGHQIRAIGGTMLENKEASIARCEDIDDFDKMRFNGRDMTWAEFKRFHQQHPVNPWSFNDLAYTRTQKSLREQFNFAWTLIGQKICQIKHKGTGMIYVPFNQATIDYQRVREPEPKNYIYMIDSSGMIIEILS